MISADPNQATPALAFYLLQAWLQYLCVCVCVSMVLE